MPVTITDVDEFTEPMTAPATGQKANQATFLAGLQAAANRTRNLKNRVEVLEAGGGTVDPANIDPGTAGQFLVTLGSTATWSHYSTLPGIGESEGDDAVGLGLRNTTAASAILDQWSPKFVQSARAWISEIGSVEKEYAWQVQGSAYEVLYRSGGSGAWTSVLTIEPETITVRGSSPSLKTEQNGAGAYNVFSIDADELTLGGTGRDTVIAAADQIVCSAAGVQLAQLSTYAATATLLVLDGTTNALAIITVSPPTTGNAKALGIGGAGGVSGGTGGKVYLYPGPGDATTDGTVELQNVDGYPRVAVNADGEPEFTFETSAAIRFQEQTGASTWEPLLTFRRESSTLTTIDIPADSNGDTDDLHFLSAPRGSAGDGHGFIFDCSDGDTAGDGGHFTVNLGDGVGGGDNGQFTVQDHNDITIFFIDSGVTVADPGAFTDSIGGSVSTTFAAIADPADTPASADALRDDLVANTLPPIRNALSTLIDIVDDLKLTMTRTKLWQ